MQWLWTGPSGVANAPRGIDSRDDHADRHGAERRSQGLAEQFLVE
jgi:hypothetical protein